jgi:hypothetical protein
VIGTSRVAKGFSGQALTLLGPEPVANLGISGGLPRNYLVLADESLAGGSLERAFIGVDFNMLHQRNGPSRENAIATSRYPTIERMRTAFLSHDAMRTLASASLDCRPRLQRSGAPVLAALEAERRSDIGEAGRELRRILLQDDSARGTRFENRLGDLRDLVRRLREADVEVVLFSAPYREKLQAVFEEAGMRDEFERFHAEIAKLAHEEGVRFVDLHDADAVHELGLPACPNGGIGCHYLDLTHYDPLVGERVAVALNAHAGQ